MLDSIWNVVITIIMLAWLAGTAFASFLLADGNQKIAGRFQMISLAAWFIVASQLYYR